MLPAMPYTPIVGTLGYILSPNGSDVLLVHRNARPDDESLGKYNGLGGKLEANEDVATCMVREIREEAGIEVTAMQLRGTVSWPGFGKNGEDWLGFIYLVTAFEGTPHTSNLEGDLEWQPLARLLAFDLPMWPGDAHFLSLVFDTDPRPFHGIMPYHDGEPTSWSYVRL